MNEALDIAIIHSIQVGLPKELPADGIGGAWESGIFKHVVPGPIRVGVEGFVGDGQAYYGQGHGGPDRAVLAYSADHYPVWQAEFPSIEFPPGAFGENLVVSNLNEGTVCLGDRVSVGDAELEVSIYRAPCSKIERRCKAPGLLNRVRLTGRIGWFYRVLKEGSLVSGDALRLEERCFPQWTIAKSFEIFTQVVHEKNASYLESARDLSLCPALPVVYRDLLLKHCERLEEK